MDWKQAMEEERAALMRVVALLGALACLAELAASRSPAMRGFVLWILRPAEVVARDFVAGGQDAQFASMPVGLVGARPADAMRLAASLRTLARQLKRQARLLCAACVGGEGGAGVQPRQSGMMLAMQGIMTASSMLVAFAWPNPAPDTS
jgi:hypothetical protein